MQDLKNDCIGVKAWPAKTALMLLAMLMWSCSTPDDNVGTVDDLSRDRADPIPNLVPDVAARIGKVPLVVVSHGSGGEYSNHISARKVNALVAHVFLLLLD